MVQRSVSKPMRGKLVIEVMCLHNSNCLYTPFDMFPKRCNFTQFIYFWKTALHVSGYISTHHQEHIQVYLQYLVLVKPLL